MFLCLLSLSHSLSWYFDNVTLGYYVSLYSICLSLSSSWDHVVAIIALLWWEIYNIIKRKLPWAVFLFLDLSISIPCLGAFLFTHKRIHMSFKPVLWLKRRNSWWFPAFPVKFSFSIAEILLIIFSDCCFPLV